MLAKLGVDISRLKRPMRRALQPIDNVFIANTRSEAVLTSTYEGTHSPSSLHYADLACDFRWPKVFYEDHTAHLADRKDGFVKLLRDELGNKFDVVSESSHIHIEYDPKGV